MIPRLANAMRRFGRDQSGAAAVYFALVAPALLGGVTLGAEASNWLLTQRKLQQIADVAAYSGAVRRMSGGTEAQIIATAQAAAQSSGLITGDGIIVTLLPNTADYSDKVQVTIDRTVPRYFSAYFSDTPVAIDQSAVAGALEGTGDVVCMLALSKTANGAVTIGGSSEAYFDGCTVASNSTASDSFLMNGGSVTVSAACVDVVGGVSVTSGLTMTDCLTPRSLQRPIPDPYGDLSMPAVTGTPEATNAIGTADSPWLPIQSYSGWPMSRFVGGLTISGDVQLGAGLYVIDGGTLKINSNVTLAGSDVTFFLANGAELQINGGAELNLTAPSSGPYAGLLIFGERSPTGISHTYSGNASSVLKGAFYLPGGDLNFLGNAGSAESCLQVMADTITISGNSELRMGCVPPGGHQVSSNKRVALIE